MRAYINSDTGEAFTFEEVEELWYQFADEATKYKTHQDFIDSHDIVEVDETAYQIVDSGLFNQAVELMDNEIRKSVQDDIAPCADVVFLHEYMRRHLDKYGVDFII